MIDVTEAAQGAFFDFSEHAKFQMRGSDRLRFLNGQITNDIRKATEQEAIEACVLNAKGKIDAHLFLSAGDNAYLFEGERELREILPVRLDRYIIADDVEIEDVTEQFGLFHILTSAAPNLPNEWKAIRARRFVQTGWDVWCVAAERENVREFLAARFSTCDGKCAETLRIESGLARWGRELTNEIIPVEANLEERCIDYAKGCYIGQEVISRMKMAGQTNKKLCGLIATDGGALTPGMRLATISEASREAGWVTSVADSPRLQKQIALGFVKRGSNEAGTNLNAVLPDDASGAPAARVEVVALPFI